jgi:hypothetical protein
VNTQVLKALISLFFSLDVGKYTFDAPGQAVVSLDQVFIGAPEPMYSKILKVLNAQPGQLVACNLKTEIVFKFGSQELRITSDDYLYSKEEG